MINASKCNSICRSVPTLLLTENESVDNVQVLRKASVCSVDNTLRWFGMVQCVCFWCLSGGLRDSNASPTPENPSTGRSNLDVFNLFVICKEMCLLYQSTSLFILISQVIFFFTIQCNCFVQRLDDVYLVNNQIYNDFLISFLFLSFRNTMLCFIQELNKNKIKITWFSLCLAYFEIQLCKLFC